MNTFDKWIVKWFLVIVLIMVVGTLWVAFILTISDAGASTDSTVAICDTVDSNSVAAYDGHNIDSSDANTRHCVAEGKVNQPAKKQNDKPVKQTTITVDSPVVVPDEQPESPVVTDNQPESPVVVPDDQPADDQPETPVVTDDGKKHCNNGDGNGAEGCNASDKGNQDETLIKGDKDVNHPSK